MTTKTPVSTTTGAGGAATRTQRVRLADLPTTDDHKLLSPRGEGLCRHHVRTLTLAARNGCKLPPVTLWAEQDEHGEATGRLLMLDGHHRLAALRGAKPGLSKIDAQVFRGTVGEARLKAVELNTQDALPLTLQERLNAAWRAVREGNPSGAGKFTWPHSKADIARSTGTSMRTVAAMRARWRGWPKGRGPDGEWWKDRRDDDHGHAYEAPDDEAKAALAEGLRKLLGPRLRWDTETLADVLEKALGQPAWYHLVGYLAPDGDGDCTDTGLEPPSDF